MYDRPKGSSTGKSINIRYHIFIVVVVLSFALLSLYLCVPTLERIHNVAKPYVTYKNGLLGYNASIVDYYNGLLSVKHTLTFELVGLLLLICCVTSITLARLGVNNKITLILVLLLTISISILANPLILRYTKSYYSYALAIELQSDPINIDEVIKKTGVTYNQDKTIKLLSIDKNELQEMLKGISMKVTIEEFKSRGKLDMINTLNDLYYLINEDSTTLYYSTSRNIN